MPEKAASLDVGISGSYGADALLPITFSRSGEILGGQPAGPGTDNRSDLFHFHPMYPAFSSSHYYRPVPSVPASRIDHQHSSYYSRLLQNYRFSMQTQRMTVTPEGRAPVFIAVYSVMLALSTAFVWARVYTRAFVVKNLGADDYCAFISWILFVFFYSFATAGAHHGTGQHLSNILPATEFPIAMKWWWACEPVYVLCSMALKLSIAFMLLRLTIVRTHRCIIYAVTAVTQAYSVFYFFLFVFQCRPSSYFWTQYTGGEGSCLPGDVVVSATYGYSAILCLGDWIFAILPVFMVWDLQMNRSTKISVASILAMGAIASTATVIRFPYVASLADTTDFLYATVDLAIWSIVETGLGLIACSAATLRPLARTLFANTSFLGSSGARCGTTNHWPSTGGAEGYIRSGADDSYGMRSDLGKKRGVTTTVQAGSDLDHDDEDDLRGKGKGGGAGSISDSEKKLKLPTSCRSSGEEEAGWDSGIRKTTVSKQVVSAL